MPYLTLPTTVLRVKIWMWISLDEDCLVYLWLLTMLLSLELFQMQMVDQVLMTEIK